MNIVVFCGSFEHRKKDLQVAHQLGHSLAQMGHLVITGGGPGLMDAVLKGARDAGGETEAVQLVVPNRTQSPYAQKTSRFDDLHQRQQVLMSRGDLFIAFSGGVGTAFEIFDLLASARKDARLSRPILILGAQMRPLSNWIERSQKLGIIPYEHLQWQHVNTVAECVSAIGSLMSIDECHLNSVEYVPFVEATMTSLESKLGYQFKNPTLIQQALTHSSFGFEKNVRHNERLEFLGDSILGYLVAQKLFDAHPNTREGDLSKQKSAIVSAQMLAQKAQELNLGRHLRLGTGERRSRGAKKDSILADAMEGIIAAVAMDGGIEAASTFIDRLFEEEINATELNLKEQQDFKTELQERVQGMGMGLPDYVLMEESGPAHNRRYLMSVQIVDTHYGQAWGSSKKNAQQAAAKQVLEDSDAWQQINKVQNTLTSEKK